MLTASVHRVAIHQLAIPMRGTVDHAAARREFSDPVIVEIELIGGVAGYGETLARPYVTGEDADSVAAAIRDAFVPLLFEFRAQSFPEALDFLDNLPWKDGRGNAAPAARAAVELAVLDASMKRFCRSADDVAQWMGDPSLTVPGSKAPPRFSGVLATDDLAKMKRQLRLMWWGGLRDFKIKVGSSGDIERVREAVRYLASPIAAGRASVRVDANGAWNLDEAAEWLSAMADVPLAGIEQPLPRGQENLLANLHGGSDALMIHDESLITESDARRLVELGVADSFNIRISKCGGFLPSLRLAAYARKCGTKVQLGCMVGETSILSAAGLQFLEVCRDVRWAEGCFGSFLLRGDVVRHGLRFGYGGRPPSLGGPGLGVQVDSKRLGHWALSSPREFMF